MKKVPGQKDRILAYLKEGKKLTRLDSWERLGVLEAPARICELRQEGYDIETELITVRNRYGEKAIIARWQLGEK